MPDWRDSCRLCPAPTIRPIHKMNITEREGQRTTDLKLTFDGFNIGVYFLCMELHTTWVSWKMGLFFKILNVQKLCRIHKNKNIKLCKQLKKGKSELDYNSYLSNVRVLWSSWKGPNSADDIYLSLYVIVDLLYGTLKLWTIYCMYSITLCMHPFKGTVSQELFSNWDCGVID